MLLISKNKSTIYTFINRSHLRPIKVFINVILLSLFIGCARAPLKSEIDSMRKSEKPQHIYDDLELSLLLPALEKNVDSLKKSSSKQLRFGPTLIEKDLYIKVLETAIETLKNNGSLENFYSFIDNNFDFYEVYGASKWGEVLVTSYYTPIIEASLKKNSKFSQPIYRAPPDLVIIDLKSFLQTFPHLSKKISENSEKLQVRGRIIQNGSNSTSLVTPFYNREEIDFQKSLTGKGLEIAWVDPIDAFFLQIQGSGTLRFEDGTFIRVGYAEQNGHPYTPIGKFLFEAIPREKMSLQRIENYLRSLPKEKQEELLIQNQSYIFFQVLPQKPLTSLGSEVTAGRTMAADQKIFPKGALAFLEFEKPNFENSSDLDPIRWINTSRFVIDQDSGGAIRGPGHIDLFWGEGQEAGQNAGVMKHLGHLYYLVPNELFLSQIKNTERAPGFIKNRKN